MKIVKKEKTTSAACKYLEELLLIYDCGGGCVSSSCKSWVASLLSSECGGGCASASCKI